MANKIPVNGYCQCNSSNNYYLSGSACVTTCSGATPIKNAWVYACVSACSLPYEWIKTSGGEQSCV